MDQLKTEKPTRNKKQNNNKSGKKLAKLQRHRCEAVERIKLNLVQHQKSLDKVSKIKKDKTVDTKAMEIFTDKINKATACITNTERNIQQAKRY